MACASTNAFMLGLPCRTPCVVSLRPSRVSASAAAGDNSISIQQQPKSNGSSSPIRQRSPAVPEQSLRNRRQSPLTPLDLLWDPFMPSSRSFSQMMDLMNQMIEKPSAVPQIQRRDSGRLPWDVMEDEKSFMMRVDMPGLTKDEVKVSVVDDGYLVIKGETSSERKEGDKWAARSTGSYESRIMVPENVELENIKAELRDGVLYVTIPKKSIEAKKPIEIQVS